MHSRPVLRPLFFICLFHHGYDGFSKVCASNANPFSDSRLPPQFADAVSYCTLFKGLSVDLEKQMCLPWRGDHRRSYFSNISVDKPVKFVVHRDDSRSIHLPLMFWHKHNITIGVVDISAGIFKVFQRCRFQCFGARCRTTLPAG